MSASAAGRATMMRIALRRLSEKRGIVPLLSGRHRYSMRSVGRHPSSPVAGKLCGPLDRGVTPAVEVLHGFHARALRSAAT